MQLTKQTDYDKKMYEAPTNYFILLLTLNMTMLAEHRPKDPAKFFDGGQKIHLKI